MVSLVAVGRQPGRVRGSFERSDRLPVARALLDPQAPCSYLAAPGPGTPAANHARPKIRRAPLKRSADSGPLESISPDNDDRRPALIK
jgi:hypothetical protein